VLSDRNQNWFIHEWLTGHHAAREWSVLHARSRENSELRFPPLRLSVQAG
jgi:hypothetical protein